ncbi:S-locus glycoprotein [Corchorus olitorius]|uniref:Receptor-like serine/threonine-protein kinase n=1 Tax=Corchorus olitorius TaxID=93759 RepID=A0A1R3I4C7_9ROSI|nr:S-locus glycoprotein [Corchorus olitorius]
MGRCKFILLYHISLFLLLFHGCSAANNITLSNPLSQEQVLTSSTQNFELGFFQPNNNSVNKYVGIWHKHITPRRIVWVANREKPVTDSSTSLTIDSDGNLKLVDGNQLTLWFTNVSISSNTTTLAQLLDDGNLALKEIVHGTILWQSFEHPSDTLLLGGSFGFNTKTGERRVLTSWKSDDDPSPGSFVLGLDPHQSPPQAYTWKDSLPYWRSGPWDKTTFTGIQNMESSYSSVYALDVDDELGTVYFYAKPYNQSFYRNIFLPSDGYLRIVGEDLDVPWEVLANPCDIYGTCGPFGVCKPFESPICSCLEGFIPRSNDEWSKGNWTKGCVGETELLCEANENSTVTNRGKADGFRKIERMKLPDFYEFIDTISMPCQQWCFNNCSCIAYADVYGIGCLVWSGNLLDMQQFSSGGQDFFLLLTLSSDQTPRKKLIISLTTISAIIIILVGILAYVLYRQRSRRNIGKENSISKGMPNEINVSSEILPSYTSSRHLKFEDPSELPMFDLNSILVATDNFSIQNKLGQGGFGPVYKGKLQDEKLVAVKRLSSSSGQGLEEFKNEVMLISKLQHRNLGTQDLANTHKVVGTLGYMSPEYALGGIFSEKSDVFSFGVLVLEIVNGRKVTTPYCVYQDQYISLLNYAWQMWHESKEIEFMDEALATDSFSSSEVKRCIHVGLLCVQDHAENRPSMPEVVFMLSSETELPKPKQPTFTFHKALNSDGSNSKSDRIWSVNEVTGSVLVGR